MKRAELIDYVEKARFIDLYAAEQMGESVITVYRAIGGAIQIGADNLIVRRNAIFYRQGAAELFNLDMGDSFIGDYRLRLRQILAKDELISPHTETLSDDGVEIHCRIIADPIG